MKKKIIIDGFKNLKSYRNEYKFLLNFRKYRPYDEKQVRKSKKGRFVKICDDNYVKLPKFTKKLWVVIAASLAGILVAGAGITATVFFMPHKVTLNSTTLDIGKSSVVRMATDFKCTFKIKDEVIGSRYMDNIDIDKLSISVNGRSLPPEAFSFVYQTNTKNELTINKKYLNGDVTINADLTKRTQKQNCFYFEYDICDYANFSDVIVTYPSKDRQGDINAIDKDKTKSTDDIYLKDDYDIAIVPKKDAQEFLCSEFDLLIVREDNSLKLDINAREGKTLPKNVWLRSNARYTKINEDFTIKYNSDYTKTTMEIPYFFIRDNGSFRLNPDVEA